MDGILDFTLFKMRSPKYFEICQRPIIREQFKTSKKLFDIALEQKCLEGGYNDPSDRITKTCLNHSTKII